MKHNKKTFKDDIEAAEKNVLIVSWIGILSALGMIAYAIWSF
tara:strand:- start:379 stop:504 length:126 start_codon:yes stop_codon:yes gene_type:complete